MNPHKLKDIGEVEFIRLISSIVRRPDSSDIVGIGDDCAIIPFSQDTSLLVTCDTLVEKIHFLKNTDPEAVGYKALAVNVSDIAAMGGTPRWAFLSLALPPTLDVSWATRFFQGFETLAKKYPIFLLGGDTNASPGPIVITITLLGTCESSHIKLRSRMQPGDIIALTGDLGGSAAGLNCLLNDLPKEDDIVSNVLRKHLFPTPHLLEGQWLGKQPNVHAMIDVSDGIDKDLERLCKASQAGVNIIVENLPITAELTKLSENYGWDSYLLAATGGEDYVLAVAINENAFERIAQAFTLTFGTPLFPIGQVTTSHSGVRYQKEGREYMFSKKGYDHFTR